MATQQHTGDQLRNGMNEALKAEIDQSLIDVKEGWCWPEKACAMAELIISTNAQKVVEIGIFGGRSLVPQALALKSLGNGLILGIDPWRKESSIEGGADPATEKWWKTLDLHSIHKEFMEHVWRLNLQDHCLIMRSGSEVCVRLFQDQSIDILHIDGNHSELVSCRDVKLWCPKVRVGGHIWFDDTNWESVSKALWMLDQCCSRVMDEKTCRLYKLDRPFK